ncbi:MAG: SDR family NAD(P)-dependent oxidoreductase, partial [Gammaproteobacteria bacterium]|nr:SDR family NAD(P)-dependent oxidoreductase [Gammaproteobacteria bacterium]
MRLFDLTGKHIAVTGASSGFGHHFAGVLAEAGARVSLGARRTERIDGRVKEIRAQGGEAFGAPLDVSSAASVDGFIEAAEAAFGPIDVLINNAGVEAGAKTYTMID